jgi:methionyl-tRNA synthetase
MMIRKLSPDQLIEAYSIKAQLFYPWEGVVGTPFGSAWAIVPPSQRVKPHQHHERETFFIVRGCGRMTVGGDSTEVGQGDVIYIPPFSDHILENTSETEELHFVALWWEDAAVLAGTDGHARAGEPGPARFEIPVLAGWDTVDRFGADVYARYARMYGVEVHRFAGLGEETGETAAAKNVQAICNDLLGRGWLVMREAPVFHCISCERDLPANGIAGRCPRCGAMAQGELCTDCGRLFGFDLDLAESRCRRCGAKPKVRILTRLHFRLSGQERQVAGFCRTASMSPRLRTLVDRLLEQRLPDVPVSGTAFSRLPLHLPGLEDQAFAPAFVVAASLAERLAHRAPEGKTADREAWKERGIEPVAFFKEGQVFFYTALLPAVLAAYDRSLQAPSRLIAIEPVPGGFERELEAWSSWLERLGDKLARDYGGRAPGTAAWTAEHRAFLARLQGFLAEAARAYGAGSFSLHDAARVLGDLVSAAERFAASEEPWAKASGRGEERNTGVALELLAARLLAVLAAPLLPDLALRLWRALGATDSPEEAGWTGLPGWVPSGQQVAGLETVFSQKPELSSCGDVE